MGDLGNWKKEQSDFISLKDGEEFTGVYKGWKLVGSRFDPEKQIPRFTFEINGKEKSMDNGNGSLLDFLDGITEGQTVNIKRTGEKVQTKYHGTIVG